MTQPIQVVIWDERKVFGSRGQGLKDDILGKEPPPLLENNGKSSHSVKVVKKDSHSIRIVSNLYLTSDLFIEISLFLL